MELPLPFKTFRTVRFHLIREVHGMGAGDLLLIPQGREDNVLWNMGHLLCSLSRLTYVFSGHDLPIPEGYLRIFGKGTSAANWDEAPDVEEVLEHFHGIPKRLESDYLANKFTDYQPLEIAPGHVIESVEEAVNFHCFHEGLHIGMIITLKDLMGAGAPD